MNPLVINIQKCSIHDGPGIRTTVFFKGCPLECEWCHNPESQSYTKNVMYNSEKCSQCGACVEVCPEHAIFRGKYHGEDMMLLDDSLCEKCSTCLDYCINNAREIVGEEYEIKELVKEIEKDSAFYEESGGGVTLSGGEVMAQDMDYISKLARICKNKGIHVAIDTCGYSKFENYEKIAPYADLFLYDIKLIDSEKHEKYTGKPNGLILDNLKKLSDMGANINVRIPLIENVNVDKNNEEVGKIIEFLKGTNVRDVNLLPYHSIGKHKYEKMYLDYPGEELNKPSDDKLDEIKNLFIQNGFNAKIGG